MLKVEHCVLGPLISQVQDYRSLEYLRNITMMVSKDFVSSGGLDNISKRYCDYDYSRSALVLFFQVLLSLPFCILCVPLPL